MNPIKMQIYDPPMCCSSGVCGPNVNPDLVRFSTDLNWLKQQGVEIERYNLSSHPQVFAQQETVRQVLTSEGSTCLPLIVVNDVIVSKGIYPERNELMKMSQINEDNGKMTADDTSPSGPSESNPSVCGPGCNCGAPSGSKKVKVTASLFALLTVGGILIFKAMSASQTTSKNAAAQNTSAFAVAPIEQNSVAKKSTQIKNVTAETAKTEPSLQEVKAVAGNSTISEQPTGQQKIGEYLESMGDLNAVAMTQDAVFVYIPSTKNEPVDSSTEEAVFTTQKTLKSKNITVGVYTLKTTSQDYSKFAAQVQAPSVWVASKGKGTSMVDGDITENKLLQAFTASSKSGGGCCPSSKPGSAGCK